MKKSTSFNLTLLIILILMGQLAFFAYSPRFTAPQYEGRIYATTGVRHQNEDLHKLNEAAHAFGNTIIGWTKFPSFNAELNKALQKEGGYSLGAYLQERQNIIFTLSGPEPISQQDLMAARGFMQDQLDEYNQVNQTQFVLSNVDYETAETRRSYAFGALAALLASGVLWLAVVFVRREFF